MSIFAQMDMAMQRKKKQSYLKSGPTACTSAPLLIFMKANGFAVRKIASLQNFVVPEGTAKF